MDEHAFDPKIGRRVRDIRTLRGWSLQKLGGRAGIPLSTLGRIEQGQRGLTVEGLVRLAAALDVGVMTLLGDDGPKLVDPAAALVDGLPGDAGALRGRLLAALRVLAGADPD